MPLECDDASEWWHGNGSHLMEHAFPTMQSQPHMVTSQSPSLRRILERVIDDMDDRIEVPVARTPLSHSRQDDESMYYPEPRTVEKSQMTRVRLMQFERDAINSLSECCTTDSGDDDNDDNGRSIN